MIERALVQIRERSAVDLLDLALVVVRRRPRVLGLAALAGIAPFATLNAWLFQSISELPAAVPMFLWILETPFATAPLTVVLGGLMFGRQPTPGQVAITLVKGAVPLLVLRFLLFFWRTPRMAFANEVILLERGRWWKVFSRGRDLASGRSAELFLLGFFQIILTYLFATVFYVGLSGLGQTMMGETVTWEVPEGALYAGWLFQTPIWLATAFFAVVRFLTYIDQRIRLEGWEVELRLRAVGEAMKEARRW